MLKERTQAAAMVVDCLIPTEASINTMVGNLATLTATMLNAMTVGNLPVATGKDAFDRLGEANAMAIQIRSKVLELHASLSEAKIDMGLRAVSFGAWQDCKISGSVDEDDATVVRLVA